MHIILNIIYLYYYLKILWTKSLTRHLASIVATSVLLSTFVALKSLGLSRMSIKRFLNIKRPETEHREYILSVAEADVVM